METPASGFKIKIADKIILVEPGTDNLKDFCRDYLTGEEAKPDVTVRLTGEDIEYERVRSEVLSSESHFETLALERKIATALLGVNTVLFHCSCIAIDGEGICFTAPCGTGKSTHTNLWKEQFKGRVTYINDDKPFIRISDNKAVAYGSPWNGEHHLGSNASCTLKAICILKRDNTNHIERISAEEAYPTLLEQIYRPRDKGNLRKTLELADRLFDLVNLYSLGCTMDPEAATVAYKGIMEGQGDEIKGRICNL